MSPFTLHHGNCIDIMKQLPSESVDMVLTDPPYVCHYRDRSGRTVANDNTAHWIAPAFAEVARVMKPDTVCVSFYGWTAIEHFMVAWKAAGLVPIGHIVWAKEYASKTGYLASKHEQAFLLAKGNPPRPEKPLPDVLRWKYSGNPLHPTQKAVEVLVPIINAFTKPGALILDPFMGSGSTGAAAARTKRRFTGIELERGHYASACHRLKHSNCSEDLMAGVAAASPISWSRDAVYVE